MPEAVVGNITGEDVKATCNEAKHTAAGMDQWAPADLKELSDCAYQYLADMMNTIEQGAPWPEALLSARAAFLAKDANDALIPLAYGVLLMLPRIYRTWANIRLKHLKPWIAAWKLPEMYAGIEGQGAADASYGTASQIEHCMVHGVDFTGGASDIYTCFD